MELYDVLSPLSHYAFGPDDWRHLLLGVLPLAALSLSVLSLVGRD